MNILNECGKIKEKVYKYFMEECFIQILFYINNICLESPLSKRQKRPQHSRCGLIFCPNASHRGLLFQLFFLLLCSICVPAEQFHFPKALILLTLGNSISYYHSSYKACYPLQNKHLRVSHLHPFHIFAVFIGVFSSKYFKSTLVLE